MNKMAEGHEEPDVSKMKKIISYLKPIEKNKVYHRFNDCFYDRNDEEAGPMVACDGCDLWFHNDCIDYQKSLTGPSDAGDDDGAGAWFCPDCKSMFLNYRSMKQEIEQLKSQLLQLSRRSSSDPTGKSAPSPNYRHEGTREPGPNNRPSPRATKKGKDNAATPDKQIDEILLLKRENETVKIQVASMEKLMNQILEGGSSTKNAEANPDSVSSSIPKSTLSRNTTNATSVAKPFQSAKNSKKRNQKMRSK